MLQLKLKSLWYALPYMSLFLLFIIAKWSLCKEVVCSLSAGMLPQMNEDEWTELLAGVICAGITITFLILIISGRCQRDVHSYIRNNISTLSFSS